MLLVALLVDATVLTSAPEPVTFMGEDFLLSRQSQMATCDLPGRTTKGFSFRSDLLTPWLPRLGHIVRDLQERAAWKSGHGSPLSPGTMGARVPAILNTRPCRLSRPKPVGVWDQQHRRNKQAFKPLLSHAGPGPQLPEGPGWQLSPGSVTPQGRPAASPLDA